MDRLRAFLFVDPAIVLLTIVMGTVSMVASLFDRTGNAQHRIARRWSRMLLRIAGVHVTVEGLERIDLAGQYVLAANHLSLMDIPVMLAHVPLQFRFFAKKSLFGVPFLGWHLDRAGHLPVVREDPRAGLKAMTEGARLIRERHVSVLLFPEGSRSGDGRLREFKDGAAYVAVKAGIPILPIGISGTREIVPMGSTIVKPGSVTLRFGDPLPVAGLTIKDRAEITERSREAVARLIGEQSASPLYS